MHIDPEGYNQKKCQIRSRVARRSRDLLSTFWDPSIELGLEKCLDLGLERLSLGLGPKIKGLGLVSVSSRNVVTSARYIVRILDGGSTSPCKVFKTNALARWRYQCMELMSFNGI